MTEIPEERRLPDDAFERQRSLLRTHVRAAGRSSRHTRRRLFAIAAAVLVVGLVVAPAVGLGSRLLDLIQGPHKPPDVAFPAWSPDGQTIAFERFSGDWYADIYAVNADGSGERELTRDVQVLRWSPDGRQIAFQRDRSGDWEVHVMNADGSGERRLTHGGGIVPAWSPTGGRSPSSATARAGWAIRTSTSSMPMGEASEGWQCVGRIPSGRPTGGRSRFCAGAPAAGRSTS